MRKKRIVITGIGIISPIGTGKEDFWSNLFAGKSGFRPITLFETSDLKVDVAGEVTNFDARNFLGKKGLRDLSRSTKLLCAAAKLAIEDSRLQINEKNNKKIGVSIGTNFGSLHTVFEFDREYLNLGPRLVNPSLLPNLTGNAAASHLGIRFNIKGFNSTISTGMCSSIDALDYAMDAINFERARIVVVGAVEELSSEIFLGFYKLNYLAGMDNKPLVSCPFDLRRNGVIFSEGAVVLIVEDLESAYIRKANIYAEIKGIGSYFDPYRIIKYNPKGIGMRLAMELALKDADIKPNDINYICCNSNSTHDADLIETKAIKDVFGDYAYKIPVSSIKSMLGESYSVSGGFGIVATIGAINRSLIPPTMNYKEKDPGCDLDYVINKSRERKVNNALVNTFDFNGSNSTLIISKIKGGRYARF